GAFRLQDVPPGVYDARVEADGHLIKLAQFEVVARETARPEITLLRRPRRSLVRVTARAIVIRRQINFATDSDEILEQSFGLMEEIADVILRNPQLASIEIQGHTDDRGGREHNEELSQRRADAVRVWLIQHGVEAHRLQAVGYGQTRPLVPNITSSNRARNRRVQFVVQE
ncbi:MAG: OmpA family protein, partial [Myxococcales bacterium]|nr:OmpA family protein [Myxococcales bacterium]